MELKQYPVEVKEEDGAHRFCISCEAEDRDGDILVAKGCDSRHFMKNPVILWAHDYSGLPIGRAKSLSATMDNRLLADIEYAPTPFAEQVRTLVKAGFLKATSVGFNPLEAEDRMTSKGDVGRRYTRWELLEVSIVPVPSNPSALVEAIKSKGLHLPAVESVCVGPECEKQWIPITKAEEDLDEEDMALLARYAIAKKNPYTGDAGWLHKALKAKGLL